MKEVKIFTDLTDERKVNDGEFWKAIKQNLKGSVCWTVGILLLVKGVSLLGKSDQELGRTTERSKWLDGTYSIKE